MATWIDFKELRQRLNFEAVLRHYGVELTIKKGKQHQGFCPLPTHPTHAGPRRSPSFSANLEKGIFQCFGCGGKGNVIEFAALMEGLDPKKGEDFRKAALLLDEHFGGKSNPPAQSSAKPSAKTQTPTPESQPVVINAPLDFELQGLDASHPYLTRRGFSVETIAHFGLGYCARGLMAGRVAIPLHDQAGNLIGYAGRLVDETTLNEQNPKYKLPGTREHEGVQYEFHKSLFLYNGYRITWPAEELVVVEGFPSVWWLWQAGYQNVVGLMGAACSEEQARAIVESLHAAGRLWIMPDSDEAGSRCAESVLTRVSPHRFTRWAKLPTGKQPTDLNREELATILRPGGGQ